jgi:hypothetical protein
MIGGKIWSPQISYVMFYSIKLVAIIQLAQFSLLFRKLI